MNNETLQFLDQSGVAVFLKDENGIYKFINDVGARMLDKAAFDVIGKSDYDFFESSCAASILERDRQVIESRQLMIYESFASLKLNTEKIHFLTIKKRIYLRAMTKNILGLSSVYNGDTKGRLEVFEKLYSYMQDNYKSVLKALDCAE